MSSPADRRPVLERLAGELAATDKAPRQAAAHALLEAARQGEDLSQVAGSLVIAAGDVAPAVRRQSRLALVVWGLMRASGLQDEQRIVLDALGRDEASRVSSAADVLAPAWCDWEQPGALVKHLVPLYVRAVETQDPTLLLAGLHALRRVADLSCSLDEAIAPLGSILALAPPGVPLSLVVDILLRVANSRHDIRDAAGALAELLDGDAEGLAWRAAQALGRHLALEGDEEPLARLLTHPRLEVRQGAAEALSLAAHAAVDVQFAVPALNAAALDEAGGVSYHALRALCEAAFRGADVTPAREALEAWSTRRSYSTDGWYPYLYHEDASDLAREHPGQKARNALRIGEQNRRS